MRGLLGLVALVAVGCAALINASALWASLVFTGTLAVLLVAILASVFRRGSARASWLGFVVFGWGYLWLAHLSDMPVLVGQAQPAWRLQQNGPLATTKLLWYTYHYVLPLVRTPPPLPPPPQIGGGFFAPVPATSYPDLDSFMRVGHSLWALLLAYLGGQTARYFYATREKTP